MKVVIANEKQICEEIANEIAELIKTKPNAVLGLATGTSPLGVYRNLIKLNKDGNISFKNVVTFNLDEYVGLGPDNKQSYRYFMNTNLFNYIDIDFKNTFVPIGVGNYKEYAEKYDKLIDSFGGIDYQILGVGSDGHIGFNEPGTDFNTKTHITELTESTIKDNSRFFEGILDVPTQAVTMGMQSIMNAKKIVLIATSKSKAKAIKCLINGNVTKDMPCSILQTHQNCTIYVDKDAYSLVK